MNVLQRCLRLCQKLFKQCALQSELVGCMNSDMLLRLSMSASMDGFVLDAAQAQQLVFGFHYHIALCRSEGPWLNGTYASISPSEMDLGTQPSLSSLDLAFSLGKMYNLHPFSAVAAPRAHSSLAKHVCLSSILQLCQQTAHLTLRHS